MNGLDRYITWCLAVMFTIAAFGLCAASLLLVLNLVSYFAN